MRIRKQTKAYSLVENKQWHTLCCLVTSRTLGWLVEAVWAAFPFYTTGTTRSDALPWPGCVSNILCTLFTCPGSLFRCLFFHFTRPCTRSLIFIVSAMVYNLEKQLQTAVICHLEVFCFIDEIDVDLVSGFHYPLMASILERGSIMQANHRRSASSSKRGFFLEVGKLRMSVFAQFFISA